jgi:CelD/BcsL family acetyltransferase involved in cellulose biosynthesis
LKERNHKEHWVASVIRSGFRPGVVVLEECTAAHELNEAERFYIAYFRFLGCRLTNATEGGEGAPGVHVSEASRAKMSAARRGRKKSPEHIAAVAAALQGHPVSDETRRKIGAKSKGNKNCVGRKVSEATLRKMSESGRRTCWNIGKRLPEEVRLKMKAYAPKRARGKDGTFVKQEAQ